MEDFVLEVILQEVRHRKCPGCALFLLEAAVNATFIDDKNIRVTFVCVYCEFSGGGEFAMTSEIVAEARAYLGNNAPISQAELDLIHDKLENWDGRVSSLFEP